MDKRKVILMYVISMAYASTGNAGLIEGLTTAAADTAAIPARAIESRPLRGPRPYYRDDYYGRGEWRNGVYERPNGQPYSAQGRVGQAAQDNYGRYDQPKSLMGTEQEQQYKMTNPVSSTERAQQRSGRYNQAQQPVMR